MSVFKADNLSKSYKSKKVVDDVSLTISNGEVVSLLGPNGAGKTTSFYMALGLIKCDQGTISIDDVDITHYPMHARANMGIGYLPQEPSIFRKLNVEENLLAILESQPGLSDQERNLIAEELMHELHISHLRHNRGMSLSGGERRRVEIARSLVTRPRFILMDEPFAGVDPISVVDIQSIIKHLRERGIGVLITDHNVRETLGICDRAYIMNNGKIIAKGEPEKVLENPQVREVYLGHQFQL
jgi:lipopolysaccharide export system ATP-binding protein